MVFFMEKILQKIAEKEGVSVEAVRREIEIVIEAAQKNTDPKAQAFWQSVPCKDKNPTAEEAILHIAKIVEKKF